MKTKISYLKFLGFVLLNVVLATMSLGKAYANDPYSNPPYVTDNSSSVTFFTGGSTSWRESWKAYADTIHDNFVFFTPASPPPSDPLNDLFYIKSVISLVVQYYQKSDTGLNPTYSWTGSQKFALTNTDQLFGGYHANLLSNGSQTVTCQPYMFYIGGQIALGCSYSYIIERGMGQMITTQPADGEIGGRTAFVPYIKSTMPTGWSSPSNSIGQISHGWTSMTLYPALYLNARDT